MDGLWDTPDLTAVIRVAARNVAQARLVPPPARPGARAVPARSRRLRAATRPAQPRVIAAHYDLGNELFELMLDPTMMYSCAVFPDRGMTLEDAQSASSSGCARSSSSARATTCSRSAPAGAGSRCTPRSTRGCRVTTTTISREQHDHATRACAKRGSRRPRRPLPRRLPRPPRLLRQARLARDDRGGRLAALRHVLRALPRAARARRHDAAAGDHDRRPRLRGREGVEELHPHLHLPRAAACPRRR